MELKDHLIVPAGEAFNKLFFNLLKEWASCRREPERERPIQKLMHTYIDICHRNSYGPLWITLRSIRYDDVFFSPIQVVLKGAGQGQNCRRYIKEFVALADRMTNRLGYNDLPDYLRMAVN
jgi:hypothetical protein